MSLKDIGKRVSLSAPAVKRRVDRLQSEGVIKGYTTTVDHSAFGWNAHAFVELFCEGRMSATEVREAVIQTYPAIPDIVRPLMQTLDTATLQALNARVQIDGESAEAVAEDYLRKSGFLVATAPR